MLVLSAGLLLFLAAHSVRIFAEDWRGHVIARLGEKRWKGLAALLSLVGFALIVWGFRLAGAQDTNLWSPPTWGRHLAALLTLPAFVLLAAAHVPGNRIRPAVGHPMVLGVAIWAFAHLMANGRARDLVLFGAFLTWAIVDFAVARRREPAGAPSRRPPGARGDAEAIVIGVAAWALFATWLHGWLFGVRPFG